MSNKFDIKKCLNQSEICEDNIDPSHAAHIAVCLNKDIPDKGDVLPLLWHWAFFIRAQPYSVLGLDGQPASGGFPTPIEGRSRMWAGGRIKFLHSLRIGVSARRQSEVIKAEEKHGSSGELLVLTVKHDYLQEGKICITEEQDIIYRTPAPPKLIGSKFSPDSDWHQDVHLGAVHLFRYSAVTFNSHRIHYDVPYAKNVESYPGLVVHGPLIATLMLNAFNSANPKKIVVDMSYRGLRPLIAPAGFRVAGKLDKNRQAVLWAEQGGTIAHQARISIRE